jgi:hypothetical protein
VIDGFINLHCGISPPNSTINNFAALLQQRAASLGECLASPHRAKGSACSSVNNKT